MSPLASPRLRRPSTLSDCPIASAKIRCRADISALVVRGDRLRSIRPTTQDRTSSADGACGARPQCLARLQMLAK